MPPNHDGPPALNRIAGSARMVIARPSGRIKRGHSMPFDQASIFPSDRIAAVVPAGPGMC
jgi:hypothetical protein